ncbi:hypothetical protein JCM10213_006264 [Rhodosporidiobolus nylandii]
MASPAASTSSDLTTVPSSAAALSPTRATASTSTAVPASPFLAFRTTLTAALRRLTDEYRGRDGDVDDEEMRAKVDQTMQEVGWVARDTLDEKERFRADSQASAVQRALEEIATEAAVFPADAAASRHLEVCLDLVLTMWEAGYADETLPLNILTSLMELRPIGACEPLFGYIERRVERLTRGMEYQRGRGPILLRLLNDLLRRLPRSQSGPVILSGRILMLLSSVYPLGEKSGVNLRGNFNVAKSLGWEVEVKEKAEEIKEEEQKAEEKAEPEEDKKMEVEEGEEEEPEKGKDGKAAKDKGTGNPAVDDPSSFYTTFWSLQRFFTNPHLLFSPAPAASTSSSAAPAEDPMATLRTGLTQTLAAFAAATRREKELGGSGKDAPESAKKGKAGEADMRDGDASEGEGEEYFFPKFLTSRNLLDLELSDPLFRLQLLTQTLILTQYLLSLTPTARTRAQQLPVSNPAAFPAFVLQEADEKWVREIRARAGEEMDKMEGGKGYRRAIRGVLEREQNWTDWKLRSCFLFTRTPPVAAAEQGAKASERLKVLGQRPRSFPHKLGNARLDTVWRGNLTSLDGWEPERASDPLPTLFREHRLEKARLKQAEAQARAAASGSAQRAKLEETVEQRRTRLQSLQWRAIRTASTSHLNLFSQIGAGDLDKLEQLLEEERRARDDAEEAAEEKAEAAAEDDREEPEEAEGYRSDESALGLGREKRQKEKEARAKREKDEAEAAALREREAGTPEPKPPATDVKMEDEEGGTPPPPSRPSAPPPAGDEPGTPPPKDATRLPSPGTPGTPKRPRPNEEDEDVDMKDEGKEVKRQRTA